MGWLSDFGKGLDDSLHNIGGALDDYAHFDFSGADDRMNQSFMDIMGTDIAQQIGVPVLNYFTYGLGGTAAQQAYNRKKYGSDFDLKGLARNAAASYVANGVADYAGFTAQPNTSLSNVGSNVVRGAGTGAASAAIRGENIGQGAKSGAIGAGVSGGASYAGNELGALLGSQQNMDYGQSPAPRANEQPSWLSDMRQQSQVPGASPSPSFYSTGGVSNSPAMQSSWSDGVMKALGVEGGFSMPSLPSMQGKWGDMAQGLMGLYQGYDTRRRAKSYLSNLTGMNGAYGEQLQKQLMARDAAAGRRSDYGGRAVQLQSELAKLQANQAPAVMSALNMQQGGTGQMLGSGLQTAGRMGWLGDQYTRQPQMQPQSYQAPYLPGMIGQPQAPVDYSIDWQKKRLGGM